ncbi:MAG: hypothetical protein RL148_2784 [Planctomycetota bacterium]|jgi:hypothetical protein
MRNLGEPGFHWLMAGLVVGSLLLDHHARKVVPTWTSPTVGMITFALGLVWVGLAALHRIRELERQQQVLRDRVERLERRTDALLDDARRRRDLPFP